MKLNYCVIIGDVKLSRFSELLNRTTPHFPSLDVTNLDFNPTKSASGFIYS